MYKYLLRVDSPETGEKEESLFCESILTNEQVKKLVVGKIRGKYPINDEMKIQRLGIVDPQNVDFLEYNKYAEDCRTYGAELKAQSLVADKETWADYQRRGSESEAKYISRLKEAGLI